LAANIDQLSKVIRLINYIMYWLTYVSALLLKWSVHRCKMPNASDIMIPGKGNYTTVFTSKSLHDSLITVPDRGACSMYYLCV